jgi:hypothetical protein
MAGAGCTPGRENKVTSEAIANVVKRDLTPR